MAKRLGIYTLGHYMSLKNALTQKLWNPLLENFETWELSELQDNAGDRSLIDESFEGMGLTHEQVLDGFFPLSERIECLERIKREFTKNFDNLVQILSMEVHKPLSLARAECDRCLQTIDATIALGKELLKEPAHLRAQTQSLDGESLPFPRRLILGMTPFNFPLNLSLHKIAPALLAGSPFAWRPSSKGQLSALALIDVLHAARVPAGMIALLPMSHDLFWNVLQDPRIEAVSFTGSSNVGWDIQKKFRGPAILELGGAAPVYLEKLTGDALTKALQDILKSAYSYSGQSCISAQSLFIEESLYDESKKILIDLSKNFATGKTWDEKTLCSGVIDEATQQRIEKTLSQAQTEGATLHRAPTKEIPHFVAPTLVENPSQKMLCDEIFAPVLNIKKVKDFAEFKSFANKLPHRLQAGVFSTDENTLNAARTLDFGGVALNLSSSQRIDALPYGGKGLAGLGSESPRDAWAFYSPYKTIYKAKI